MRVSNCRCPTLLSMLLLVTGISAGVSEYSSAYAGPQPTAAAEIDAAVQASFGSVVEVVKAFKPYYVTGDINGDGAQDLVVVVRVKGSRANLPQSARVLDPFSDHKVEFPKPNENRLGLAIIHGWKSPRPSAAFVLAGESSILILDYERATSGRPEDSKNLISIMRRSGRRPKGQKFPRAAKGDVVLLGTQVGDDGTLYWNGRTYRWEESDAGN